MDISFLSDSLPLVGLYFITFSVCLVSAIVPVMVVELFLVSVSALSSPAAVAGVILSGALGQIAGKFVVYLSGYGLLRLPFKRYETKLDRIREKFQKWRSEPALLILFSGFSGIPPFYGTSLFSGLIKISPLTFAFAGFFGLLLRFTIVILFPQVIKRFLL